MSYIDGKNFDTNYLKKVQPENGVLRLYWAHPDDDLTNEPSLEDRGFGIRYEWYYKDGKRADGISKSWWGIEDNNNLKCTMTWKDGHLDGLATHYYRTGNKMEETFYNFKGDRKYVLINSWTEDGKQMVKDGTGKHFIMLLDSVEKGYEVTYKDYKKNGWECWSGTGWNRKVFWEDGELSPEYDNKKFYPEGSSNKPKIKKYNEPWTHYVIEDFFPKDLFELIKQIPSLKSDYTDITGFRDAIKGRVFLGNPHCIENGHLVAVSEWLNQRIYWERNFGCDLSNTYLRPEVIDDRYPFFHAIHTDTPEKKLSIIVNISKEDEQNLATDLYSDKDTHFKKLEWKENSALLFVPTDDRFHGFDRMKYKGIRRIMIINFVDSNVWRNKNQCWIDNS
jgi:hypothetical protein